jgi:hypothetical protein
MNEQQSVLRHLVDILNSIDTDLLLPLRTHESERQGGFLSISRQVFCYIDYLGALSTNGKNASSNAVAYMEKYLARVNSAYSGKSNLMFSMWRHGTVHEYDPKVFKSDAKQFRLRWGANNSSRTENRRWHLACFCKENKPNCYFWFINLFELVEDLKESIRWFIHDLEFNEKYLAKARSNLEKLSQEVDLDKPVKANLKSEAENLVADTAGVLDERNQVIHVFKDRNEFEKYRHDEWSK